MKKRHPAEVGGTLLPRVAPGQTDRQKRGALKDLWLAPIGPPRPPPPESTVASSEGMAPVRLPDGPKWQVHPSRQRESAPPAAHRWQLPAHTGRSWESASLPAPARVPYIQDY